jgi:hypothetical protein
MPGGVAGARLTPPPMPINVRDFGICVDLSFSDNFLCSEDFLVSLRLGACLSFGSLRVCLSKPYRQEDPAARIRRCLDEAGVPACLGTVAS